MINEEDATYRELWMKRFRDNLFGLLGKYDLTIGELSVKSNIPKRTIEQYLYEGVCPSAWNIVKIARGLGLPVTDVLDYFY